MHCLHDLRSTKLNNVKFQQTFGWAAMKSLFHLRNSGEKDIKERNHRSKDNLLRSNFKLYDQSIYKHKQFSEKHKSSWPQNNQHYPSKHSSFSFRNRGPAGKYGSDALLKRPPINWTKQKMLSVQKILRLCSGLKIWSNLQNGRHRDQNTDSKLNQPPTAHSKSK